MKRLHWLSLVLMLLAVGRVSGQDETPEATHDPALGSAPPVVQDALILLNEDLDTNLTLSQVNWTWREEVFSDTSLGCPQEGQMYAQMMTRGYVIEFERGGTTYDYRATADGTNVFLCERDVTAQSTIPVPTGEPSSLSENAIRAANANGVSEASRLNTEQGVTALADWSADGTAIIAVSSEESGGIFVYAADDQNAEPEFYETDQPVTAFDSILVNGVTYLAVGGLNGSIAYFPIAGFDVVLMEDDSVESGQAVNGLALAPSGNLLASASGNSVYLWNTSTGGLFTPIEHDFTVTAVAFSPSVAVMSVPMTEEATPETEPDAAATVEPSIIDSTNMLLAIGTSEGLILLYEVSFSTNQLRYREMQVLGGHEGAVNDLAFSPNGALLASGGMDGTARLWNINAQERTFGNVLATLDSDTEDVVLSLAFSPDGSLLATAGGNGDNAIRLWNVTTPAAASLVATLTGHQAAVGSVGFSANGEFLLSASDDGSIRLWSAGR